MPMWSSAFVPGRKIPEAKTRGAALLWHSSFTQTASNPLESQRAETQDGAGNAASGFWRQRVSRCCRRSTRPSDAKQRFGVFALTPSCGFGIFAPAEDDEAHEQKRRRQACQHPPRGCSRYRHIDRRPFGADAEIVGAFEHQAAPVEADAEALKVLRQVSDHGLQKERVQNGSKGRAL